MSDGPPLEPRQMRTHSDLEGEKSLYVKMKANVYYVLTFIIIALILGVTNN